MDKESGSPSGPGSPVAAVPSTGSGSPASKKQRLDSEAKNLQSRKVGILCHSVNERDKEEGIEGLYEIKLYMVEIDSESGSAGDMVENFPLADPVVHFTFPYRISNIAVCVWRSTVYMFWGYNYRTVTYDDDDPIESCAKKFELSEAFLARGDCRVKEEEFIPIRDSKHPKVKPIAVPTPDGKQILVFGNRIPTRDTRGAFELYDPEKDSWDEVPALPWKPCWECGWGSRNPNPNIAQLCKCFCMVDSYSFIDESHFLLVTGRGSLALDLCLKKWTALDIPDVPWDDFYFLTAKGRYVLTPKRALLLDGDFLTPHARVRDFDWGSVFPLSTFAHLYAIDWLDIRDPSILSLNPFIQVEGGDVRVCNHCVLQIDTLHDEEGSVCRLLVDVCRTELPTLRTQVSNFVSLRIRVLDFVRDISLISV